MGKLALVVEREPVYRLLLRRALRQKGYEVCAFRNREEAEEFSIGRQEASLVVLDDPARGAAYRFIYLDKGESDVLLIGWDREKKDRPRVILELIAMIEDTPDVQNTTEPVAPKSPARKPLVA